VIVAVRDDAIAPVAIQLCATGLVGNRHVLLHCAGALAAATAFGPIASQVGGIGTMHPLRAIARADEIVSARGGLRGTVFGVEGDTRGVAAATQLVAAMGGTALPVDSATMGRYHTAAAMASNFAIAVLDAAVTLLASTGVEREAALGALLPLAQGALANAASHGLVDGLTGPIRRGDAQTVRHHLDAVAHDPELAQLYRVLGRRTLALAQTNLGDEAAADLRTLLHEP
jgi:predicted short-subunit dehydrogenase-like oxidoreductase (DUF2520 family)